MNMRNKSPYGSLNIRENIPLAIYTSWGIGGPANYFIEPINTNELISSYNFSEDVNLPVYIIGNGSNVLVDDNGINGVIICLKKTMNSAAAISENAIYADAGCSLPKLSQVARNNNISGFEFLIGIPGTVGGGISCNAGLGGPEGVSINDFIEEITMFDMSDKSVKIFQHSDIVFDYRFSNIKEKGIVLSAKFKGSKSTKDKIKKIEEIILANRKAKQPLGYLTAGSVFKQPLNGEPAGYYIDKAGLKGFRIGDAVISDKHANWIINEGNATASEIKKIVDYIQGDVNEKFSIQLEREIIYLPSDCD